MNVGEYKQVWQEIAEGVIEDILNGLYEPGERLKETVLGAKYKTSNTPVREALRYLERTDFVEIIPRAGAVIKGITEKELRDLISVQCVLEEWAVIESVDKLNQTDIDNLTRYVEEIAQYWKEKNYSGSEHAHVQFHTTIWMASNNGELVEMLKLIYTKVARASVFSRRSPDWSKDVEGYHRAILKAVINKEGKKAGKLVRKGLEQYLAEIVTIAWK